MTDPAAGPRVRWTAQSIDAGWLRFVDGPYAGRTLAEFRAALRAAGVDMDEAAANEVMARAFNDREAEGVPLMVVRSPHGPEVDAFRLEPCLYRRGRGRRTMAEPRSEEPHGATCDLVIAGAPADLGDRLARVAEAGGLDSASELAIAVLESALADLEAAP